MSEPTRATAGDTWAWTRPGGDYPASAGWSLTYYLATGSEAPKAVNATASGADFAVNLPAATTATYTPGLYHWTARVVKAGEVHIVGTGTLQVDPDPSTTFDRRTPNQLALAAITAALSGLIEDPITEYEIDGFKVKKMGREELLRLQSIYRQKVRFEQGGAAALFRSFPVRFNP